MGTHATELEVVGKDLIADDVVRIRLASPDRGRLPDWTPGAHIRLGLPVGERPYSLCGSRWEAHSYQIAVLREREGRGGSAFLHDELRTGDRLLASAPRNDFPVVPAQGYLFVAGGIGITPFLPMMDQARRTGAAWHLVYGGRTRSAMAFADQLEDDREHVTLCPRDDVGLLDIDGALARTGHDSVVYCCGPEALLSAVTERVGRDPRRVRTERFTGVVAVEDTASPFTVALARDGRRLTVPAHRTLLDALNGAGLDVQGSCLDGACGSCATRVLDGDVDHRDLIQDRPGCPPDAVMYPCVSRARSGELVLDL